MTTSEVLIANVETAINEDDFEALVSASLELAESYRIIVRQTLAMERAIHDLTKRLEAWLGD